MALLPLLMLSFSFILSPPLAVATAPSADTLAACSTISSTGTQTLTLATDSLNPGFIYTQSHYWSAANADLYPTCEVFPTTAEEVSSIVSIIQTAGSDVNFAVKSGGHNPNVGYSSTDGGILISMSNLSFTVLSFDQQTVDVGPGARWVQVVEALEPYGVTVVSGRLGDVGVGGLTLGGGLSFLSANYGLVCDNVVNYEIVLASASIVNANASSNSGLFWALKGGGNQFGIVTKFTMKTHSIGQVWGGIRSYAATEAEAILNATQDFTENYNDPNVGIIVTGEIAIDSLLETFIIFFFYDGATPPDEVFGNFNAIPTLTDDVQTQSYYDFINSNDGTNLYGLRYLIRGTTLPNLPNTTGQALYNYHYSSWKSFVMTSGILHPGFVFSFAFQPMPYIIPAQSIAAGGNALGMDPKEGDRMWMEYDISWLTAAGDADADTMARNITESIDEYAKTTYAGVKSSLFREPENDWEVEYTPIFMNDVMYDQLPLQSYENNGYERLKAIRKSVDPEGFFPSRTAGFKFT